VAAQRGAPGEDFDMPRLVGALQRQQLQHLAEMRMDLPQVACRHQQRGVLVLDEVRHHLHDCSLDGVRQLEGRVPVDGGGRVPLGCGRLPVELAGRRGPEFVAAVQREEEGRAAGFHRGAARGQAPAGSGVFGGNIVGAAGRLRAEPAALGMRAARDHCIVCLEVQRMPLAPAPGLQVHAPVRRASAHAQLAAHRPFGQCAADEQQGALVEAQRLNIDSRDW